MKKNVINTRSEKNIINKNFSNNIEKMQKNAKKMQKNIKFEQNNEKYSVKIGENIRNNSIENEIQNKPFTNNNKIFNQKEVVELLGKIADLHSVPEGAFSFRENGNSVMINSTSEIEIVRKKDKPGIDIFVKPSVKNKSLHIPVIITKSGVKDLVFNDFFIGDNSEITIVAGCGIHNASNEESSHNGIHSFQVGKNCKVKYIEKHLGIGGIKNNLNPTTQIMMQEGSVFEMETYQIGGVNYSDRKTFAKIGKNSKLLVKEKILTENLQQAKTSFFVDCDGFDSGVEVVSRSVAKGNSTQIFESEINGNNKCFGRVECDGIVCDKGKIKSKPFVNVDNPEASLTHEAQIGKIAGEQLIKLMSLGLSQEQAENEIIKGFLN